MMSRRRAAIRLALLVLSFSVTTFADPAATQQNLGQSLFDQAKQLMKQGRYAEACPKLEESERLDPGGGTLLNLALCYERQGRTASAWSSFKEALSLARRDGRNDRARAAEEHIQTLEPKLSRLTIQTPDALPNQTVLLDGESLGRAAWGVPMAVDPGPHRLLASAPGKRRWTSTVSLNVSEQRIVRIPALEAEPLATQVTPERIALASAPAARPSSGGQSAAAWVLFGSGVVAVGAGSVLGVIAIDRRHKSNGECPTDTTCSDQGVRWNNQAKSLAWASDIGIGIGAIAIGIGGYLLLHRAGSAPRTERAIAPLSVDAALSPRGAALHVAAAF